MSGVQETLDDALIAAHTAGDHTALIGLYSDAAAQTPDLDTACFYLTHAFVFALEAGDARAGPLRAQLAAHGRESAD